jgi:hypothetical protein
MCPLRAGEPDLGDGGGSVGKQLCLVGRIGPGASDDAGAVARTDLVFIDVDQGIQCCRIDQALFDQQGLQRLDPQGRGGRDFLAIMVVPVGMMMLWIAAHGLAPRHAMQRRIADVDRHCTPTIRPLEPVAAAARRMRDPERSTR